MNEISNLQSVGQVKTSIKFIEELAIVITAKNLTPTMMSQDFLKFSGIIPQNWELDRQPVLNPQQAQLTFKNGVTIMAQPGTLTMSESVNNKNLNEVSIAQISGQYVAKLPHAEYRGFSLNPKILVPIPDEPTAIRQYFTQTLLNQGSWQYIGRGLLQANINLLYQLERCQLSISISQATLQAPQQNPLFAVLFSGNFNYSVASGNQKHTTNQLFQAIQSWQHDFRTFRDIVSQKFLEQETLLSSVPESMIFPMSTL